MEDVSTCKSVSFPLELGCLLTENLTTAFKFASVVQLSTVGIIKKEFKRT